MNCGFFRPNSRPSTTLIGASTLRSRRTNPPPSKRRSCSKSLIDFSKPPEPYTSHQDRIISPRSVSPGTPPFVRWVLLLLPGGLGGGGGFVRILQMEVVVRREPVESELAILSQFHGSRPRKPTSTNSMQAKSQDCKLLGIIIWEPCVRGAGLDPTTDARPAIASRYVQLIVVLLSRQPQPRFSTISFISLPLNNLQIRDRRAELRSFLLFVFGGNG